MSARGKARKRAVDILYESDLRAGSELETLAAWQRRADPPVAEYTAELVRGVAEHRGRIDELLGSNSHGWPVPRMPTVDRAVLRLATYELIWRDDVPDATAIDEAVQLAKELSTPESPAFVNGLLARLLSLKPSLAR
jgi:N utilization substance protein B